MKKFRKIIVGAVLIGLCASLSSCGNKVFPIDGTPAELHEEFDRSVKSFNGISTTKETSDDVTTKPNDVLIKKNFNVYYDNTTGCFMEYANLRKENSEDMAYQNFATTMATLRTIFDSAGSYTTYTIQSATPEAQYLTWTEYKENIFSNFGRLEAYTYKESKDFAKDSSPINMWVDDVKKQLAEGDDSVSVFITDLNEQNGLLSQAGKDIKEILDRNPEEDFIIISYDLSFKGKISSPTIENEGDNESSTTSKVFDNYVDRKYYILAFGSHDEVTILKDVVNDKFGDVETEEFIYRDTKYSETENVTVALGTGEKIEADFVEKNPPLYTILDGEGNEPGAAPEATEEETEEEGRRKKKSKESDSGGGIENLSSDINRADFFDETFSGSTYILKNYNSKDSNRREAEVSFRLDNTELYTLDVDNASIYTYEGGGKKKKKKDSEEGESPELSGWSSDTASLAEKNIYTDFSGDTVTVRIEKYLTTKGVSAVVVSVPVYFEYENSEITREVKVVSDEVAAWIESCATPAPPITDANRDKQFTKTYKFDDFMDKITGYRATVKLDDNTETISTGEKSETTKILVDRLNIIIVADEDN